MVVFPCPQFSDRPKKVVHFTFFAFVLWGWEQQLLSSLYDRQEKKKKQNKSDSSFWWSTADSFKASASSFLCPTFIQVIRKTSCFLLWGWQKIQSMQAAAPMSELTLVHPQPEQNKSMCFSMLFHFMPWEACLTSQRHHLWK